MALIKTTFAFIVALGLGFGIWFLVGWFLSNEFNIMLWPWYGKLIYVIFGWQTSNSLLDNLTK